MSFKHLPSGSCGCEDSRVRNLCLGQERRRTSDCAAKERCRQCLGVCSLPINPSRAGHSWDRTAHEKADAYNERTIITPIFRRVLALHPRVTLLASVTVPVLQYVNMRHCRPRPLVTRNDRPRAIVSSLGHCLICGRCQWIRMELRCLVDLDVSTWYAALGARLSCLASSLAFVLHDRKGTTFDGKSRDWLPISSVEQSLLHTELLLAVAYVRNCPEFPMLDW
jgi:hypothetical protein